MLILFTEQLHLFVTTPTMFDEDAKFKCYFGCILSEAILPNGKLDTMPMLKQIENLPPEEQMIMINMGKKCIGQKDKDICEKSYKFFRCMKTVDMVHFYVL